jgi:hypothetical protein
MVSWFYAEYQTNFDEKSKTLDLQLFQRQIWSTIILLPFMEPILTNLADNGKYEFEQMQRSAKNTWQYRGTRGIPILKGIFNRFRKFVMRGNDNDWRRALVSGIAWMSHEYIAINYGCFCWNISATQKSIKKYLIRLGCAKPERSNDLVRELRTFLKESVVLNWSFWILPESEFQTSPNGSELTISDPRKDLVLRIDSCLPFNDSFNPKIRSRPSSPEAFAQCELPLT